MIHARLNLLRRQFGGGSLLLRSLGYSYDGSEEGLRIIAEALRGGAFCLQEAEQRCMLYVEE